MMTFSQRAQQACTTIAVNLSVCGACEILMGGGACCMACSGGDNPKTISLKHDLDLISIIHDLLLTHLLMITFRYHSMT